MVQEEAAECGGVRLARGSRAFCVFQEDAVERLPSGTMGLALRGVGLIRRRYKTFSDVYLPLPGSGWMGSMTNLDAHWTAYGSKAGARPALSSQIKATCRAAIAI